MKLRASISLFDFGSPDAYLAHQMIPEIEATHRREIHLCASLLLGGIFKLTNNSSPMVAFGPVKNKKLPYEMLETQTLYPPPRTS